MTGLLRRGLLGILTLSMLVSTLAGCATPSGRVQVVGTVSDRLVTVQAPTLAIPAVNLDAGFAPTVPTAPTGPNLAATTLAARLGLGSFVRVASVRVREGDRVTAGDVVAVMDDRALRAAVVAARADARVARSQVPVLESRIEDTFEAEAEIEEKRRDVEEAIQTMLDTRSTLIRTRAQLLRARAQILAQRPQLVKARADLRAKLAELRAVLAQLPPTPPPPPPTPPPPGTPVPPSREEILAAIAQLEAALAQVETGLAKMATGLVQIRTGLSKIATGLEKISDGLDKARDGLKKLDRAQEKVRDARAHLRDLKRLAKIAADTATVALEATREQRDRRIVRAPVSGVVVDAAGAGDLVAPGATLVTVREDAAVQVTAWLSPAEAAQVCLGDRTQVRGDWMAAGDSVPAGLTRIGERSDYPPTRHATEEVHLTRAVPMEFTATGPLPPGVPVDLAIDGCRLAART